MISLLITVLVVGLIIGLAFWAIDLLPFIVSPFKEVAKVIIIVIAILFLLSLLGGGAHVYSLR